MNVFYESLKQSHAASDLPLLRECYQKFFPDMLSMHDHRKDGQHQRNGIDRSIVLSNGKCLWIDEKIRGRNRITKRVYQDIAVEECSSWNSPGWVIKPLLCDFIAYAIGPLGRCYLLPVQQLQKAWQDNGAEWKQHYHKIEANNGTYTTISWGIPVPILFSAIGNCLRTTFAPVEVQDSCT